MGQGQSDEKNMPDYDRQTVPDPAFIPEDKLSEGLDKRMKELFEDARKREMEKDNGEASWI